MRQKITTYLWFDADAEEAIEFYASIFPESGMDDFQRGPDGKFFAGTFRMCGQEFMALNGGPMFKFNESISLFVNCDDQAEVDRLWAALTADGGEESMCGWLKDKYGLSWQIIPTALRECLGDPDPEKAGRAMQAMLGMRKIDIAALRTAVAGE